MRPIKFRGRSLTNGKWVIGDSIKHTENADETGIGVLSYIGSRVPNARKVGAMKWTPVDSGTIGQFTGFLDRTGKEIYEGDIIMDGYKIYWCDSLVSFMREERNSKSNTPKIFKMDCVSEDVEIVGNIHDKLTKGGEE